MAEFDPYYKWFAIKPEHQPPHFYRLLGVELFEPDPDVIDTAADQRMTFLQTCSTGEHSALSQKLMNEVSTARVTLLNDQKRAAYDQRLRAELGASETVTIKIRSKPRRVSTQRKSRKKSSSLSLIVIAGMIAGLLFVAVKMLSPGNGAFVEPSDAKSSRGDKKSASSDTASLETNKTAEAKTVVTTPTVKPQADDISDVDSSHLGIPQDLFPVIDPATNAVSGAWTLKDGVLESSDDAGGRLNVPITLPDEYNLRLVAERVSPEVGIGIRLKAGERQFVAYIDAQAPNRDTFYGLGMVGKLERHRNATSKRKTVVMLDGRPNTIDVAVRRDRIVVAVNDRNIIDWPGPLDQLGLSRSEQNHAGDLQLLVLRGGLRVTSFSLRTPHLLPPISPTAKLPVAATLPDNAVDLLAGLNPARDTIVGDWSFEDGRLTCADSSVERIVIARPITDQYQVFLEFTPISGSAVPGLQLPFRGNCLGFLFNRDDSNSRRISYPWGGRSVGRSGRLFQNGVPTRMKISVTDAEAIVHVDGVERCRWNASELAGLSRKLDAHRPHIADAITVEGYGSVIQFSKIHWAPIDAPVSDRAGWRNPPPTVAETANEEKLLLTTYRSKINDASENAAKNRLVEELRVAANAEPNHAAQIALLRIARDLARQMTAEAVGFEALQRIRDDVEVGFQINPIQWLMDDASFLAKQSLPPIGFARLAHFATDTAQAAILVDDYARAIELFEIAAISWRKRDFTVASRSIQPLIDRAKSLQKSHGELQAQLELLKSQPNDSDGLAARAEFYCFVKEDWGNGLVFLRQASDPQLASLADRELAAGTDRSRLPELATEWAALASSDSPRDVALRRHAAELAHRVLPFVEDAELEAVQKLVTPEYLESRGILAEDIHIGSAGKTHTRNVYGLTASKPIGLTGTTIRALIYSSRSHDSRGLIEISADGQNWVQLGMWTQRELLNARRPNRFWLTFPIVADSRASRLAEFQVRFRYSSGADAVSIRHVIWEQPH
ncbi:MAG: hypothetical protein O3A00_22080 [Planctomycetota bacterium]|nr:hypothetical protein [Planctomycetota bacterium]